MSNFRILLLRWRKHANGEEEQIKEGVTSLCRCETVWTSRQLQYFRMQLEHVPNIFILHGISSYDLPMASWIWFYILTVFLILFARSDYNLRC